MSCIKTLFGCQFTDNDNNTSSSPIDFKWIEKQIDFLRTKVIDSELDLKTFRASHEMELKRLDEKIMTQIQMLNNKLDATLCSKI